MKVYLIGELRGVDKKMSSKGNEYLNVYIEDQSCVSHRLYCKQKDAFPNDLQKGDMVTAEIEIKQYGNSIQYELLGIACN